MLLILITGAASLKGLAQGDAWVMKVHAWVDCNNARIDNASYTFNGQTVYLNSSNATFTTSQVDFVVKGTNWPGVANKTMSLTVQGSCPTVTATEDLAYTFGAGTSCAGAELYESDLQAFVDFYPTPVIDIVRQCETVTLSTPACFFVHPYLWEISNLSSSGWKPVPGTTNQSVTLTAAALTAMGISPYGSLYARVTDPAAYSGLASTVESFNIYAPPPTISSVASTDVICHNQSNGTITLNVSSPVVDRFYINYKNLDTGFADVVRSVANGSVTISGLGAGTWEVMVVNNNSVEPSKYGACSTTREVEIKNPDPVTVNFQPVLKNGYDVSCHGSSDGEVTAAGVGGNGGYTAFAWSNGATGATASGLRAGTYSVSLQDQKGCPGTGQVVLLEPAALTVTPSPASSYNGYAVSCYDKQDGKIATTVTGGIAAKPYTYAWSTGANTPTLQGLAPAMYTVVVTDANNCPATAPITLTAPPKIVLAIETLGTLVCAGDQTITLEGKPTLATLIGQPQYTWASGETTQSLYDRGAGTYTLTVKDEQGCSATQSITLANPPAYTATLSVKSSFNGSAIRCYGEQNGSLAVTLLNPAGQPASGEYYTWTQNGTALSEGPTLSLLDNLGAGAVTVAVRYNTQCEATAVYFLDQPAETTVALNTTTNYNGQPIRCHNTADASIRASASGGTGAVVYTWNTGATGALLANVGAGVYSVKTTDVNGCAATNTLTLQAPPAVGADVEIRSDYAGYGVSCFDAANGSLLAKGTGGTGIFTYAWADGKTTPALTALKAGTYTVTIADQNGCSQSATQVLLAPPALALSVADKRDVMCYDGNDGQITLQAAGGVPQYQYSKDNGASWQQQAAFGTLKQGNYTLLLRDANDCRTDINTSLAQPEKITLAFTDVQPAFCNEAAGAATAVVAGGVPGYTGHWEDADGTTVSQGLVLASVKGGIYTIYVEDAHSCPMSGSVSITSTDGAKTTYVATSATCFDTADGSARLEVTDGQGPFTIRWPDGQNTPQVQHLAKGQYDVLVTDVNNCTVIQPVVIPAPEPITLSIKQQTLPTCYGSCDGGLTLEAAGGVGAFHYAWNNTTGPQQQQLCAGSYPVTVTDDNGCTLGQTIVLPQPQPVRVAINRQTLPTCYNGCDGQIEITAIGGHGVYQYLWDNGQQGPLRANICPGDYTVTATDQAGCSGEGRVKLDNTPALTLDLGGSVTLCTGQSYVLNAGTGWQRISWASNTGWSGTASPQQTVTTAGTYWIEAYNDNGCVARDTFLLETSYDLLKASFMIPQQAAVGDTVVMVDISWPMPEAITWSYPLEMKKLLDNGEVLFGQFSAPGTYEITLATHLGECFDQVSKNISIINAENGDQGGRLGYEAYVKEFTLHPNPNDGLFNVTAELEEESPVVFSVWNTAAGSLIYQVKQTGSNIYHQPFDIRPLSPGTYVLRMDHAHGSAYIRFVVY